MARSGTSNGSDKSSASLGFEAKLWLAADKLRNNMDAAEYKHVLLGLNFLKYISDIQSHTLATLRDTLLPKLPCGELSMTSVEKGVSA